VLVSQVQSSYVLVALLAGFALGWLLGLARGRAAMHRSVMELEQLRRDDARSAAERVSDLREELVRARMSNEGDVRSSLQAQGASVLSTLSEYSERLARLEEQRQRESAVLQNAVGELRRSNEEIRTEARRLAGALTDAKVRGSWGEMQLRRVLEHSGMVAHADFVEQRDVAGTDGALRPDVVVRLPNQRCVVIDAKAPLDAYLRAMNTEDDAEQAALIAQHGAAVAAHVGALGRRRYEDHVRGAVDFVVMFVPGDAFLSAAFESRPDLLDTAARQNVILASPSTLLAFLRGVACGWRERQVADEADAVAALGRELHERVAVFAEHLATVGASLDRAVGSYNAAVGSFERRLLVTARRFEDCGADSRRTLAPPATIDGRPVAPIEVA
jgi:DNA recombination protein RmuC